MDNDSLRRLVYLLCLLALIGPGVWAMNRQRGTLVTYIVIWLAIGAAVFLAAMLYREWAG